jgi:hypothetical protein
MESTLTQRRASLEEKIPDIKKTLDMIEHLQERQVSADFSPSSLVVGKFQSAKQRCIQYRLV